MSTGSLPQHLDDLFEAFPPFSTADWLDVAGRDLDTNDPKKALTFDSGEGFSLRSFYRADDSEAQPLSICGFPEQTSRCVYLCVDGTTDANSFRVALSTNPDDLLLVMGAGAQVSSEHLYQLLGDVDRSNTAIHLDAKASSLAGAALWAYASERPADSLALDLPGILAATGRLPNRAIGFSKSILDEWPSSSRTIAADGRYHRYAGGTLVHELAGMLASATDTVDMLGDGRSAPELLSRIQFIVPVGRNILLETAKLRALRLLHHRWASAYLKEDIPRAQILAISSERSETACDPHSNVLRATASVMAAYMGGADLISVRPYDSATGRPSSAASRLANNTPLILEHETDIGAYSDAAGGSYFFQAATRKLVERSWQEFLWLEEHDGLIQALQSGLWQDRLEENRERLRQQTRTRSLSLIGTSEYAVPDDACEVTQTNSATSGYPNVTEPQTWEQFVALAGEGRSLGACQQALLSESAGLTCDSVLSFRLAEPFEALRSDVREYEEELGRELKISVLAAGRPSLRAAKASFAENYLAASGLSPRTTLMIENDDDLSDQDLTSQIDVVIICSDDKLASKLCHVVDADRADPTAPVIGIAASPGPIFKEAGADFFIYEGSDIVSTTRTMLSLLSSA